MSVQPGQVLPKEINLFVPKQTLDQVEAQLRAATAELERQALAQSLAQETANSHRFAELAMAVCNLLAERVQARRVSIGMLRGQRVRVAAMSHTDHISAKSAVCRSIQAAMEECVDQGDTVLYPAPKDAVVVARSAGELARNEKSAVVVVIPLGLTEAFGAVVLEFEATPAMLDQSLPGWQAGVQAVAPRLADLYEYDRWFGARLAASWRELLARVLGPSHTWIKLAAVGITAVLAWAFFATGTFHVVAPFTLEPVQRAQITAPFNGYIKAVFVRPGSRVAAGKTVLAELHTAKLRDELAAASAEVVAYQKQALAAQARGKIADMQIANENRIAAESKVRLLQRQIAHAEITSPVSGVVLSGDLQRRIGSAVQLGDTLFRVAPISPLLARINVSDQDVLYVKVGQSGSLATASYPAIKVKLRVQAIEPLAVVRHKHNVFRVRGVLLHPPGWFRPGMQGTARIDAGRRRYLWIWTRGLVNWVRMKLWI